MDGINARDLLGVVVGQGARAATNQVSRAEAENETLVSALGVVENTHHFSAPLPAQPDTTWTLPISALTLTLHLIATSLDAFHIREEPKTLYSIGKIFG